MPRRVLITGGAGFIGSHLARRCLARGDEVHVLVRPHGEIGRITEIAAQIGLHRVHLGDKRAVEACLAEVMPHEIYHLAAATRPTRANELDEAVEISCSVTSLITLLAASEALPVPPRAFVRTGSLAEYGAAHAPFEERARELPLTPYAAGLVAGSHFLDMLRSRLSFPAITARLALVYGPGQSSLFLIPALIEACLAGRSMVLERPTDRRDLLHIDDAVEGLLALAQAGSLPQGIVNLATGISHSVDAIANVICREAGVGRDLVRHGSSQASVGIPDFRGATGRADACLNWKPRTGFADGLARTVDAARQNRAVLAC